MTGTAPTIPTGLSDQNINAAGTCDVFWNPSTNGGSSLKTGVSGCLFGYYPPGGAYKDVLTMEGATMLNRQSQVVKRYLFSTGASSQNILAGDDLVMANGGTLTTGQKTSGGRIIWVNMESATNGQTVNASLGLPTPAGSTSSYGGGGTHDVFTYDQFGYLDANGNVVTAGVLDALINVWVQAALNFSGTFFFCFDSEPDNALFPVSKPGGKGSNYKRTAAMGVTPGTDPTNAQLQKHAGAYRYIINKFRTAFTAAGKTLNVVFVETFSGFRGASTNASIYQNLYTGSNWIDWIGWDPYDHTGAPTSTASSANAMGNADSFYTQLDANFLDIAINTATSQSATCGAKPRCLPEFGCEYRNDGSRATKFFPGLTTLLTNYPKLQMILYFGSGAWGDLHTIASGSLTSTWDTASIQAFASSSTGVNASVFKPSLTGSGIGGYHVKKAGTTIATVTGNPSAPTAHLTGLATGDNSITVSAFDTTTPTANESPDSAPLIVTIPTTNPTQPPAPVLSVTAAANAPQAVISWTNAGPGGTRIYHSADGGTTWALFQQLAAGVTTYTTQTLTANPSPADKFKARALDSTKQVESADSNIVTFSGGTTNPAPLPVTNLTALVSTQNGTNSASLSWTDPSDPIRNAIQIFENLDPTDPANAGATPSATLGFSTSTWIDTGIPFNTTRTYYVVAVSSTGVMSGAVAVEIITGAPTVNAVLNLPQTLLTLDALTNPDPVSFPMDASASTDPNGLPLTYTFSVDDGQADLGPNDANGNPIGPIQTRGGLTKPAILTVTLTVTNSNGQSDTDTGQVIIAPYGGIYDALGAPRLLMNMKFDSPDPADPDVASFWGQEAQRNEAYANAGASSYLTQPGDHGMLAWTEDPTRLNTSFTLAQGVCYLSKVMVRKNITANTITCYMPTKVTTPTAGNFLFVVDANGNQIGITADLTSQFGTAGEQQAALTSSLIIPGGPGLYVFCGILTNGGTACQLKGMTSGSSVINNIGLAVAASRSLSSGSAQTTVPSTFNLSGATQANNVGWFALS